MEPDIKNFSELERLIKTDPKRADARAYEWQQFLKANIESSPELGSIETSGEFYKWAQEHPEMHINTDVWVGKEIADTYYLLREGDEDSQTQSTGVVDGTKVRPDLLGLPLLAIAYSRKPKILEEDSDFQKIESDLKKEWLKNNPYKDFDTKEGLDYLYGSLDDPSRTNLRQEAEKIFKKNPKFKTRTERYDKEAKRIHKDKDSDANVLSAKKRAEEETQARLKLFSGRQKNTSRFLPKDIEDKFKNELINRIHKKNLRDFAKKYPEKTKTYHDRIKAARLNASQKYKLHIKIGGPEKFMEVTKIPSNKNALNPIRELKQRSPIKINIIKGKHRVSPLEKFFNNLHITVTGGEPRISPLESVFSKFNVKITRGGPRANLLKNRFKNPFKLTRGKSRISPLKGLFSPKAFARRAFLLGPGFTILIVIMAIFTITFVLVFIGGVPLVGNVPNTNR